MPRAYREACRRHAPACRGRGERRACAWRPLTNRVEIEPRGALLSFASLAQALGRIVPQAAIFTRTGVEGIPLPATYSRRKARRQLGFVLQIVS
jgi:hypothetical protein